MATKREKESYRLAFNSVLKTYLELKSITGTLSCTGLYESIGRQGAGKTTFNSSVIRALPSDFLCEFERIAMKSLSYKDWCMFEDQYVSEECLNTGWRLDKHRIQEIVGKEFIKQKIYPVEQYFKPRDTR